MCLSGPSSPIVTRMSCDVCPRVRGARRGMLPRERPRGVSLPARDRTLASVDINALPFPRDDAEQRRCAITMSDKSTEAHVPSQQRCDADLSEIDCAAPPAQHRALVADVRRQSDGGLRGAPPAPAVTRRWPLRTTAAAPPGSADCPLDCPQVGFHIDLRFSDWAPIGLRHDRAQVPFR